MAASSSAPSTCPVPSSPAPSASTSKKRPTVIITIGMAGSGKTTFVQRLNSHLHALAGPSGSQSSSSSKPPYIINLDPAVTNAPFEPNIDIRDTVDYSEVMKQYNLGPNGGILTALNLFTTKFDQVLDLIDKRADSLDFIILDTPGQIEIFTWSASGSIITTLLARSYPTLVAYILDTPRSTRPATFMSNMLYACSILYKTQLPMVVVFNKVDVVGEEGAGRMLGWIRDFEKFQEALEEEREGEGEASGYMGSLMHSMSLVLDEFYKELKTVSVSSFTGAGFTEFLEAVAAASVEYETEYVPEMERVTKEREASLAAKKQESLSRFMSDLSVDPNRTGFESWDASAGAGEEMEEEEDDDGVYIDRSDERGPAPHVDMARARRPGGGIGSGMGGEDDGRWPTPG
ncbi:hypothetical protein JB92DRAFT_2869211 [Gautieria morchelliformis]|nr:hypothetical protein JB92DRAFT_2869211 [Gautieria morchelliformis]